MKCETITESTKKMWIWGGFMAIGVPIGVIFYHQLYASLLPGMEQAIGSIDHMAAQPVLSSKFTLLWIIFVKNTMVALICFLLARPTKGILPATIMFINGVVIGFVGLLAHNLCGMTAATYIAGLAPHGVFELPALFLVCSLGMSKLAKKTKYKALMVPLGLLLIAASIESYVTPLIVG